MIPEVLENDTINDNNNDCFFLFVDDEVFNDFDNIIKNEFISICHGYKNSKKYKISFVAKEFIKRLEEKEQKDKIGYIGEFLYHIFTKYKLTNFTPISIFFNSEEMSAKKGFDMLLSDGEKVWYSEVKSGLAKSDNAINDLNANRFSKAYSDIKAKVETENKNLVYWTTAIDKLCMCLQNDIDDETITNFLNSDLNCNDVKSKIIVSVIFYDSDKKVESHRIKKLIKKWKKECPNIMGVCIRKRTIDRVINLIKEISLQND